MSRLLRGLRIFPGWTVLGAACFALPGAVAGLIQGLRTNAPTAWAAVFEIGLPAAAVGAAVGAGMGSLVQAVQANRRRP